MNLARKISNAKFNLDKNEENPQLDLIAKFSKDIFTIFEMHLFENIAEQENDNNI